MKSGRGQGIVWVGGVLAAALMGAGGCDQGSGKSARDAAPRPGSSGAASSTPQAGSAATPASVPPEELVAKVNAATAITTTDVEMATLEIKRFMQAYQQEWKPLPVEESPEAMDLHDVMNSIVEAELKAQDAKARGLDRRTEFQRRLAYLERGFYAQEWDRWQQERSVPSEEQIHEFYEQNKAGFRDPERIRARQIVTETLADAEAVRAQAVQGAVFAQLARERSIGAGKEEGGDIGWHLRAMDKERMRLIGAETTEAVFFPQLESVAFTLEAGQISQPVKGPDGRYYIVLLEERKAARQQTELEVHDSIKGLLTAQQIQRLLEQLRKAANIETFPERLSNVSQ